MTDTSARAADAAASRGDVILRLARELEATADDMRSTNPALDYPDYEDVFLREVFKACDRYTAAKSCGADAIPPAFDGDWMSLSDQDISSWLRAEGKLYRKAGVTSLWAGGEIMREAARRLKRHNTQMSCGDCGKASHYYPAHQLAKMLSNECIQRKHDHTEGSNGCPFHRASKIIHALAGPGSSLSADTAEGGTESSPTTSEDK